MALKHKILSFSVLGTLALSACHGSGFSGHHVNLDKAEYWQRQSASSAIYMQGPKAQQMLHQDIAGCVVEIRELENLGEIRRAMPANHYTGNTREGERTVAQRQLDGWDTPERDGYLLNEHLDYHDFETCMHAKGWERAEYLPYTDADKARQDYRKRFDKRYRSGRLEEEVVTEHPSIQNQPPYENLNQ